MSIRSGIIALFAVAFLLTESSLWAADTSSIQGTLIDTDGTVVKGAEIRAQRLDAKAKVASTKTDTRGHYVFNNLPVGTYAVTAYVGGSPQSRAKVQTRSGGWAKVDFDLRLNDAEGGGGADRMARDLQLTGRGR